MRQVDNDFVWHRWLITSENLPCECIICSVVETASYVMSFALVVDILSLKCNISHRNDAENDWMTSNAIAFRWLVFSKNWQLFYLFLKKSIYAVNIRNFMSSYSVVLLLTQFKCNESFWTNKTSFWRILVAWKFLLVDLNA